METYQDLIQSINSTNRLYAINVTRYAMEYPYESLSRQLKPHLEALERLVKDYNGSDTRLKETLLTNLETDRLLNLTRSVPTEHEKEMALSMRLEPVDSQAPSIVIARAWLEEQPEDTVSLSSATREVLRGRLTAAGFPSYEVTVAVNWVLARFTERAAREHALRDERIRTEVREARRQYEQGLLSYSEVESIRYKTDDHYRIWNELTRNRNAFSVAVVDEADPEVAALMAELGLAS